MNTSQLNVSTLLWKQFPPQPWCTIALGMKTKLRTESAQLLSWMDLNGTGRAAEMVRNLSSYSESFGFTSKHKGNLPLQSS
jgi:hypothetical protein